MSAPVKLPGRGDVVPKLFVENPPDPSLTHYRPALEEDVRAAGWVRVEEASAEQHLVVVVKAAVRLRHENSVEALIALHRAVDALPAPLTTNDPGSPNAAEMLAKAANVRSNIETAVNATPVFRGAIRELCDIVEWLIRRGEK